MHPTVLASPVTFDPTPRPTDSESRDFEAVGRARISEIAGKSIINSIGDTRDSDSEGRTRSASNATFVLAAILTLTVIGCAAYYLTKKYPDGHLRGALDRMGTIIRIVRGDDLVDIVSEVSASSNSKKKTAPEGEVSASSNSKKKTAPEGEMQNSTATREGAAESTKSAVAFAEDLVTVIPPPAPMRKKVSFADSMGEELASELGPIIAQSQSSSLDENDDSLGSSSRSTNSGDDFTDSYSSGTFDSADEPMEHYDSWADRTGRVAFRAELGGSQIEIPLPSFGIYSPRPRGQGEFWADDAV